MRKRNVEPAQIRFIGRPAQLHSKAELSAPQTGSAIHGTHSKALARDDGSQDKAEAVRLVCQEPIRKTAFDPHDIAFRLGRGFGCEVRFLLGSRRLDSVGARLYLRIGELAPAQGKPKS